MILSLIVGIGKNREIGKGNDLLWHISEDLKNFKKITSGKPIIMGRKTYDSIGRPLPKRRNIVVSRDPSLTIEGCEVFSNPLEVLDNLKAAGVEEAVVIGGSFIYEYYLPMVDRIYLTEVDFEGEADVFFPEFDRSEFSVSDEVFFEKTENSPAWKFSVLNRL
ncbi:dihydrofolate reductase [Halobacteriovorax sp. XZX-3]|uniref:dihydrofolate reductase n=1 Tax=unclassified Halobacteriovorax TaxID=2639665 RepID=UPI003720C920